MEARLDIFSSPLAMKLTKYINSAGAVVNESTLPKATQELVKLRASQINGCGFCADMHSKDAATTARPPSGSIWSPPGERPRFSQRPSVPRSSSPNRGPGSPMLPVASPTKCGRTRVKHYDEDQLVALVGVIALINFYNRINVIIQQPAGSYEPGMFG